MIPKELELQILQELEAIGEHKSIAILHDKNSDWGYLNSDTATSYAISNKIPQKEKDGLKLFKIADLKELFKTATQLTTVVFCDYSS